MVIKDGLLFLRGMGDEAGEDEDGAPDDDDAPFPDEEKTMIPSLLPLTMMISDDAGNCNSGSAEVATYLFFSSDASRSIFRCDHSLSIYSLILYHGSSSS